MTCNWLTTDYKLAAGHNNAAGLTLVTAITDGTNRLIEPQVYGNLTRGVRRVRANGATSFAGFPSIEWRFGYLTVGQWNYLYSTYENGAATKGLVTVRLAIYGTTFANYNAVISLQDPIEMEFANLLDPATAVYLNPVVTFSRLEAL